MSALFTSHAIERMRAIAEGPSDKQMLANVLSAVDASTSLSDLMTALPGTVQVSKSQRGNLFVIRQGDLRVIVAVEPSHPGKLIVTSAYRADKEEDEAEVLKQAAQPGADIVTAR